MKNLIEYLCGNLILTEEITIYEFVALILSTISIILTVGKWVYTKYIVKEKLTYYPRDDIITLVFNESGSYVKVGFSLYCERKSILLKSIKINVRKLSDKSELKLIWSNLESPTTQQATSGGMIFANDVARAMRIEAETLPLFLIEFSNDDVQSKLDEINSKKMNFCDSEDVSNLSYDEAVQKLKEQENYSDYRDYLLKSLFWVEDEYEFEISVEYNKKSTYSKKYKFKIDEQNALSMKENIDKTMLCRLNQIYFKSSNFNVKRIKFEEVTNE